MQRIEYGAQTWGVRDAAGRYYQGKGKWSRAGAGVAYMGKGYAEAVANGLNARNPKLNAIAAYLPETVTY